MRQGLKESGTGGELIPGESVEPGPAQCPVHEQEHSIEGKGRRSGRHAVVVCRNVPRFVY
jgi:hypothetical protein